MKRPPVAGGAALCLCVVAAAACGGGQFVQIGSQDSDAGSVTEASAGLSPDEGGSDGQPAQASTDGAGAVEAGGTEASPGLAEAGASDGPTAEAGGGDTGSGDGPLADGTQGESGAGPDGSAFDPASITGLALWLDASQGVTKVAGAVSGWADRTAHHNDASQPTASLQPSYVASAINGLPALHFNKDAGGSSTATGAGCNVSISDSPSLEWGTGDFYLVVVARSDNSLADGPERGVGLLFGKIGTGTSFPGVTLTINIVGGLDSTNQNGLAVSTDNNAGDWVETHTLYNDGTPHAFAVQRVGSTLDLRVDGASVGTSASARVNVSIAGVPVLIGSGANGKILRFDGDIAEVLAVAGTLATTDRTALEAYALAKYGL